MLNDTARQNDWQEAKCKNAVTIGEFANLPGIIDKLIEAVRAGELDDQFAQASAKRGQMLRKAG